MAGKGEEGTEVKTTDDYEKRLENIWGPGIKEKKDRLGARYESGHAAMAELSDFMEKYTATITELQANVKRYQDMGIKELGQIKTKSLGFWERLQSKIPILGDRVQPDSFTDILYAQLDTLKDFEVVLKNKVDAVKKEYASSDSILEDLYEKGLLAAKEAQAAETQFLDYKAQVAKAKAELDELNERSPESPEAQAKTREHRALFKQMRAKEAEFNDYTMAIAFGMNLQNAYRVLVDGLEHESFVGESIHKRYSMQLDTMEGVIKTNATLADVQETMLKVLALWQLGKENTNTIIKVVAEGAEVTAKVTNDVLNEEYYSEETLKEVQQRFQNARDIWDAKSAELYEKIKRPKKTDKKGTGA